MKIVDTEIDTEPFVVRDQYGLIRRQRNLQFLVAVVSIQRYEYDARLLPGIRRLPPAGANRRRISYLEFVPMIARWSGG